jgi:tripartite-type tricarboxylate transporter receptor subunit TctC
MPAELMDKLAHDVARALATPELREQFAKLGAETMSMTPAEFTRFVRSEMASAQHREGSGDQAGVTGPSTFAAAESVV